MTPITTINNFVVQPIKIQKTLTNHLKHFEGRLLNFFDQIKGQ